MPSLKYDVTGVEPGSDLNHAPVGLYKAKIVEINAKNSKAGNPMLEIKFQPAKKNKKQKRDFAAVFYYILTDGTQDGRLREFLEAVGSVTKGAKKAKGSVKTEDLIGKTVQINLKSDTDLDGDYRPRVGKVLGPKDSLKQGEEEEPDEDDEEPDDDDDEEDSDDDEEDDEQDDDDDDEDEEGDEDDEDEEDDEDSEEEGYTEEELQDLKIKDLQEVVDEWELELPKVTTKNKKKTIKAILEAQEEGEDEDDEDEDGDDEDTPDYSEWEVADLKKELKDRGLSTKGKKSQLVSRLEEDDESDEDPFEDDDE